MIPGPADRSHFLEEQRRNRKNAWKFSALSVLAVLAMGMPLSLVLTPLIYAVLLLVLNLVNLVHRFPPSFWDSLGNGAMIALEGLARAADGKWAEIQWGPTLAGFAGLLLPGMIFMALLYAAVRLLLRRAGAEGVLATLGAREPKLDDFEEKQIVNLAEEMALAAGVAPTHVRILDVDAASAAALGEKESNATLVVSRGLLHRFNRDQTQGIMAHLIASVGNGDLGIAWTLIEVFNAYGLLVTLLQAPFGAQSRAKLGKLFRFMFFRRNNELAPAEAESLMKSLTETLSIEGDKEMDEVMRDTKNLPLLKKIKQIVMLPLIFMNLSIRLTLFFCITGLLGPCLALLWRNRRYLADAEAVQLTRNPDGLALALSQMGGTGGMTPGGEWVSLLFVSGGRQKHSFGEMTGAGTLLSFHPPLKRRLKRLQKMGSSLIFHEPPKPLGQKILIGLFWLILAPLFLLLAYLIAIVVAMMTMLNLMLMGLVLALITWIFHWFH